MRRCALASTFNVGDQAVYPAQGVTEICDIETFEFSGQTCQVYVLRCLDSEQKIRVPVDKVEQVGLRNLVDKAAINEVNEVLKKSHFTVDELNWNRRQRIYMDKIKTGKLTEVAEVLRNLHLMRADKQLSYGEKRVYEMAMQLLVQELSVAQGIGGEEVTEQVEQLLG